MVVLIWAVENWVNTILRFVDINRPNTGTKIYNKNARKNAPNNKNIVKRKYKPGPHTSTALYHALHCIILYPYSISVIVS